MEEKQDLPSSEEEFDTAAIGKVIKKISVVFVKYWPYLLVIIPIFITLFIRAQTIDLAIADDWAASAVYNFYKGNMDSQLRQQYKNLPEENLNKLSDEQLNIFLEENKDNVKGQIKVTSNQMKNFYQYESGIHSYTYMGDIDSYYWLRQARNILEKGHICDVIENNICYDTYTVAPNKARLSKSIHPYSIFFVYKIIKPFNQDLTLMQAQLIVPTIYAVITALLVFILVLRINGVLAALVSSVLVSMSPIFLSRSLGSDTDVYNVLFPVFIVFFAYTSFASEGWKKKAIFSAITGLFIGVYSFAWIGWWYLFDFIIIAVFADYFFYMAKDFYKSRKFSFQGILKNTKTREVMAILLPFIILSFISLSIISGFGEISASYKNPLGFTKAKIASNINLWPNVLTTVAEFNEASIPEIIGQVWGHNFFFLALLGFVLLLYKKFKNITKKWFVSLPSIAIIYYLTTPRGTNLELVSYIAILGVVFCLGLYSQFKSEEEADIKLAALFFFWVIASIYASTKGVRFVILLVPPVVIGIGISLGFLHKAITQIIAQFTGANKAVVAIAIFLIFSFCLIEPVKAGSNTAKNYLPNVNDQWWEALTSIKDNSKPDAIINSWWDFGHWFKYIADRRVTLDGSSQNSPQLHWLGKLLLTSNEKEAVGILRMLDCGGNNAFNSINKIKNNTPRSIKLLNKILLIKGKSEAKKFLIEDGLSDKESEDVLQYSHCQPPENFLIVSEDMIGKGGVWAHFGSWDFDRAWMQKTFAQSKNKEDAIGGFMAQLSISRQEAESYYAELSNLKSEQEINVWIAPWPSYIQGETKCEINNNKSIVVCAMRDVNVFVDIQNMEAYIPTSQGIKRVNSIVYTTPGGLETKTYSENTLGFSMVFASNNNGEYTGIFMQPQLVNSTFTKLFYLDGHGTSYFDPFHKSGDNFRIKIWKVNWNGN